MSQRVSTPDPLAELGAQALALESAPTGPQAAPTQDDLAAEKSMAQIEAGAQYVILMALKLARAALAKRLPEFKEECSDDMLKGPAEAAVPLLRRHLAKLVEIAGSSPELAAFVLSLLPIGMAVLSSIDKAQQRQKEEAKQAQTDAVHDA